MSLEVSRTYEATAAVLPMSIVKRSTTADYKCTQAGSGDTPLGITADWTRYAPWSALDDGNNAAATENVKVFLPGQKGCKLRLNASSGSVTPGTLLMPASDGLATPVTANNDKYIAQANCAGSGGDVIDVDVIFGFYGA
jgi:hypothetical protein